MEKCAIVANIPVSLKILESKSDISNDILQALKPLVNDYFKKVYDSVSVKIQELVVQAIKNAPEYNSLLNGQLKAEFGLPDADSRINELLEFWKYMHVEYRPVKIVNGLLETHFIIHMIQSDFNNVIHTGAAILQTEKGKDLNWLEWLLLFGDQTIIKDYVVKFGSNPNSRTGMAVMKGVTSGKWSVPATYSGTLNDNWITRAMDGADKDINRLLSESMRDK